MSKKLNSPMAQPPKRTSTASSIPGAVVNHGIYPVTGQKADYSTVDVTLGAGKLGAKMAPLNSPMTKNIATGKK